MRLHALPHPLTTSTRPQEGDQPLADLVYSIVAGLIVALWYRWHAT